ncbi:hypothetical protein [Winogradskyella sp. Asnod2-B02-A]|uniref:hypothetical protein n=1 Tax=Winogradskyella sp. Asnod2-B02-A TaxID=3160583 RepID=UPI00386CEE92
MYYLLIVVQVYCLYHAYKNNKPFYWYFLIFFVPAIGSLIYIVTQMFNKSDAEKIQEDITSVINPTKKIKELEKKVQLVDTYTNRIELADAYFKNNDITNAIIHYKKTLEDTIQDDLYARQNLILCYFQLKDYEGVIEQTEFIKEKAEFKGSKQQFCYGLALNELGKINEAEVQLKQIDRPYSNYAERLALAKFYIENDRITEGKELLEEISTESKRLTKPNKKRYGSTIVEVERMLSAL